MSRSRTYSPFGSRAYTHKRSTVTNDEHTVSQRHM